MRVFLFISFVCALLLESVSSRAQEPLPMISSYDYVSQLRWDSVGLAHLKPLLPLEGKPTKVLGALLALSRSHDQIVKSGFGSSTLDIALGFSRLKVLLFEDRIASYELRVNFYHDTSFAPLFDESWLRWMPEHKLILDTEWSLDRMNAWVTRRMGGVDTTLMQRYADGIYADLLLQPTPLPPPYRSLMSIDYEAASNTHGDEVAIAAMNNLEERKDVEMLTKLLASLNPSIRFQSAVILESFRLKKQSLPKRTLEALMASIEQDAHAAWVVTRPEWIGSIHRSTFTDAIPRLARLYAGQEDAKKYNNPTDEMLLISDSLLKWQYLALDRTRVPAVLRETVYKLDSAMVDLKSLNISKETWIVPHGFGARLYGASTYELQAHALIFRDRAIGYRVTIHGDPKTISAIRSEWNADHPNRQLVFDTVRSSVPRSGRRPTIHYLQLTVVDTKDLAGYHDNILRSMKLRKQPAFTSGGPAVLNLILFEQIETGKDSILTQHIRELGHKQDIQGLMRAMSSVNASARIEAAVELEILRLRKVPLTKHVLLALSTVKDPKVDVEYLSGCISGSAPADSWIKNQASYRVFGDQ